MQLTKEFLEQHNACSDAIRFCERNQLFGFPLERLDEIKGDYDGYVRWLRNELKAVRTYDDHGNLTHSKDSDDYECWQTFDDHGNVIHSKNSYGYEYWREYDDHGNVIHLRDSNDNECWREYDDHGNMIHSKDSYGQEEQYEVEYYDNGQLKRYGHLIIPKF